MKEIAAKVRVLQNAVKQLETLKVSKEGLRAQCQAAILALSTIDEQIDDAREQVSAARQAMREELDQDD